MIGTDDLLMNFLSNGLLDEKLGTFSKLKARLDKKKQTAYILTQVLIILAANDVDQFKLS